MSITPIDSIALSIFSSDGRGMEAKIKIEAEIKKVITYCKFLRDEINKTKSNNYIKKLVAEHMYIISYCLKAVRIVLLTSGLSIEYKIIETYLNEFYLGGEVLFEKLLKIAREEKNKDEICFYEYYLKKCLKNNSKLEAKIKCLQNEIYNLLEKEEKVKIPEGDTVILDRKKYYVLQKEIKDPNVRKEIERLYFNKSEKCLGLLEQLVVLRTGIANKNNYKNYFEYVKSDEQVDYDPDAIKHLIDDLIIKIDMRTNVEIGKILEMLDEDGYDKKVGFYDFIYYYDELCSKQEFQVDRVIGLLFGIVGKYFRIDFKACTRKNLWSDNIKSYQVFCDKRMLGYIHFDIMYNADKKISSPICIHMCHEYLDIDNSSHNTNVALMANFNSDITHSDCISLFKEMGNAIQFLFYKTTTGNIISKNNFNQLTAKVFEYIAWDKSTLLDLCNNNNTQINKLQSTRFIDFATSLKLKCVNAYFDYSLHSSTEIINNLKKINKYDGNLLKNIYRSFYENIFSSQKDIFETKIDLMHPIVILNEIGSETYIYENLIVEILSYSIFTLIKKNKGGQYTDLLSKSWSNNFKKSINKFISEIEDGYGLYVKEQIDQN